MAPTNVTGSALETTGRPDRTIAANELAIEQADGYRLIGQFISEYSQLEFTVKAILFGRLQLPEEYFDIVTAPYDFAMLCTVTKELLCKQLPDSKQSIERLFKDCRKLNDERVRVAHGLWTQGREGPIARHVSRGSLQPKYHFEQPDSLSKLTVEAQRLMQQVLAIGK
jgi:hypothetical protein